MRTNRRRGGPRRVVVVEDEAIVAQDLKESIEDYGYEVAALAATGDDAIRQVETHRPDVVLVDVMLRGPMDGVEAARQIGQRHGTPVVYLTAYSDELICARARSTLPAGYLIKPIETRQLLVTLDMAAARGLAKLTDPLPNVDDARYRWIFDAAPDGILITDESGRIIQANREAGRIFGFTEGELVGQPVDTLMPEEHRSAHVTRVREYGRLPLLRPMGTRAAFSARRKDGSLVPVQINLNSSHDERGRTIIMAVIRDVSHLQRMELALTSSETQFQALFDSLPVGAFQSTLDGRFITVNPAMVRLTGAASAAELTSTPTHAFYADPAQREQLLEVLRTTGEVRDFEVTGRRKDERLLTGLISARLTSDPVHGQCLFGLLTDITERRAMERMLEQTKRVELVGRLASGISHDFNNLLAVVLGYAENALSEAQEGTRLAHDLRQIRAAAVRGGALTSKLRAFTRRHGAEPELLDLHQVVSDLRPMLRRIIREDVELIVERADEVAAIQADRSQIEQIVVNLVVNAKDAIQGPGCITVKTEVDAGECRLTVTDTGHGMDEVTQQRIFEPFFTTKPPGIGTGLGLMLVREAVDQNGGRVNVTSAPGHGSVFAVHLPRVDGVPTAASAESGSVDRHGNHQILVVEDEDDVRAMVQQVLAVSGYRVTALSNGAEALALCALGRRFDLLLTDVVMPGMDGITLAKSLASYQPDLRILLMSGYNEEAADSEQVSWPDLGKPFTIHTLLRAIAASLDA